MKLAEALIARADAQKRLAQLRERLQRVVRVQEGDTPAEDPQTLLAEYDRTLAEFTRLVKQINRTNAVTPYAEGVTITDALADRDALMTERGMLVTIAGNAVATQTRYSRSEVRYVTTVDVAAIQSRVDDLARQYRELDTEIQQLNWAVDLIEA